jgi:hypothetical protein
MTKKKTTTKKALRTAVLPGVELPGHDDEVTAAALEVQSVKEDVAEAKRRLGAKTEELLELMKTKKLSRYHDPDAKVRVEVSRSKETVKVLRDKPAKVFRGRR